MDLFPVEFDSLEFDYSASMIVPKSRYGADSLSLPKTVSVSFPEMQQTLNEKIALELKKKNTELIQSNIKLATKIRRLESEKSELHQALLANKEEMNRLILNPSNDVPFEKVKEVCRASINEFNDLVSAFDQYSQIFRQHAQIGLQAIVDLGNPDSPKKRELVKPQSQQTRPIINYGKKIKFKPVDVPLQVVPED